MAFEIRESEIYLRGQCPIEEAEALHEALREIERPVFDLTEARYLHTAIVQLVQAFAGSVRGVPQDAVLAACLGHLPVLAR